MSDTMLARLAAPFPADAIRWRPLQVVDKEWKSQKGVRPGSYAEGSKAKFLAYLSARDVMSRLDEVWAGDWSDAYEVIERDKRGYVLSVRCDLTHGGITKSDIGYRNAPDNESEDEPGKAAFSDALKRAAVHWGVGRFLYDLGDSGWIAVDKYGRPLTPILSHESVCLAGPEMVAMLEVEQKAAKVEDEKLAEVLDHDFGVTKLDDLTMQQAKHLLARIGKKKAAGDAA